MPKQSHRTIRKAIHRYIAEDRTDYAIMISGEWGAGKTYYIKNRIIPLLKRCEKLPIYISMIGVSNDEMLENKIRSKINPFHEPVKSKMVVESEMLEALVNREVGDDKDYKLPKSIVLIFDDLERILPDYLEQAMGLINTYIEHSNTKTIFLCWEKKLEDDVKVKKYREIKEKYVRFTYNYKSDFSALLQKEISNLKYNHNLDTKQVLYVFEKGNCYNLRTMFFAVSIFKSVLDEVIEENKIRSDKFLFQDKILQLMLNYICFYAIESKSYGVSHEVLNMIYNHQTSLDFNFSFGESDDESPFEKSEVENIDEESSKKKADNVSKEQKTRRKYFHNNPIAYEYFSSISDYISTGIMDRQSLINDFNVKTILFANSEYEKCKYMLDNINSMNNDEYVDNINNIIEFANEGGLDLTSYVQLFNNLTFMSKHKIGKVFGDIEVLENKLKDGINKGVKEGVIKYEQNLKEEVNGYIKESTKKFASYVIDINDELNSKDDSHIKEEILDAIAKNDVSTVCEHLKDTSKLNLDASFAKNLYAVLTSPKTDTPATKEVYNGLLRRYKRHSEANIINQMRDYEKSFIVTLYDLLSKSDIIKEAGIEKISDIQLRYMYQLLGEIIKEERWSIKTEDAKPNNNKSNEQNSVASN